LNHQSKADNIIFLENSNLNYIMHPKYLFTLIAFAVLFSCRKEKKASVPLPIPTTPPSSRMIINAQLLTLGNLSQVRGDIAVASAGNKIVFAGGLVSPNFYSSRVDIFDITTNRWETVELSQARSAIATATLGKKIFFAGGLTKGRLSSRVDIYDTETNEWTTSELPSGNQHLAGAASGNKVVFAGGAEANILDITTNTWSTASLSEKAGEGNCCQNEVDGISASVIGSTIYFAGGLGWDVHNTIDIYNSGNNTWSTSLLADYKGYAASVAVGNTNYWAGGYTFSGTYGLTDVVEIRDNNGRSSFGTLFQKNGRFSAVQKNDSIIFFTGLGAEKNKFDVYDISNKKWLIGKLSQLIEGAAIISVDNKVYIAGGKVNGSSTDEVWTLNF
jgi:hypothetical protein